MPPYARANQLLTLAVMDGVSLGVFTTKSGGNATAENTKIRPAAGAVEVSLGGLASHEDLTIGRYYEPFRDDPLLASAASKIGRARLIVSVVALDGSGAVFKPDGNPYWTGILIGVNSPDADANSGDGAMVGFTIGVDGRG